MCRRENSTQKRRIPKLLKAYEQYKKEHSTQEVISEESELRNADNNVILIIDKYRDSNEVGGTGQGNKSVEVNSAMSNNKETIPR